MHRIAWYLAVLPLVAVASPASAGEPYYFHKAGVAPDTYVEDVAACRAPAAAGQAERADPASSAAHLLAGFLNSRNERVQQQASVGACMAGKGYERIVLGEAEFREIRMLESNDARLEALLALASASGGRALAAR